MNTVSILYQIIMFIFLTYIFTSLLMGSKRQKDTQIRNEEIAEDFFCYFLVPCINEELVIERTLNKLVDLPIAKQIIAIDDGSTDRTAKIMKRIPGPINVLERKLPNAQKGKGAALNEAFRSIINDAQGRGLNLHKTLVGVVDADGYFSLNIIDELNKTFANDTICAAQTRVKMSNVNHIMFATQDAEFFTVNNIIQKARYYTKTVGLGGNGQFFRMANILHELGNKPWGDALLDDYELTLKLMMSGLEVAYIDQAYVVQEALKNVKKFIRQRSRWVQGNLDCLKYLSKIRTANALSTRQKWGIYYFLAQPFINLVADLLILFMTISYVQHFYVMSFTSYLLMSIFIGLWISVFFGIIFTLWYLYEIKSFQLKPPNLLCILCLPISISYIYIILFLALLLPSIDSYLGKING